MNEAQTIILGTVVRDALLLAMFIWLPVMNKERAFFGVRVEPAIYRGQGRRTLHRYWLTLMATFVLFEVAGYLLSAKLNRPLLLALTSLGATAAAFAVYSLYARLVQPYAIKSHITRFASPIQPRNLKDYTHWWFEVAVAALTIAAFIVSAYYYPQMPNPMPVHWNAAGSADRWAAKSFAAVFFIAAMGFYLQLFFVILKNDLAHARITLPGEHTAEFLEGKERHLLTNIILVDWARLAIGVLFFIISLLIISTTIVGLKSYTSVLSTSIWFAVTVMVVGICYLIWRMKHINDELKSKYRECYVQRSVDEAHWRQGGLTYYNPDDPALVVEKLVGLGYTLNLAHPGIKLRIVLLAGVPLFLAWALLSF